MDARRFYAGIGSRTCPVEMQTFISQLALMLAEAFTLRSGAANGADAAFEAGCDLARGNKEIFLPWEGYNGSTSPLFHHLPEAFTLAATAHSCWERTSESARLMHARNVHQALGADLKTPVEFILCWAPESGGSLIGGTATAVGIARQRNIPVWNLWCREHFEIWRHALEGWQRRPRRETFLF